MKLPRHIEEYENKYAFRRIFPVPSELGGIEQAVVIPALAEKDSLLATLSGLSRNSQAELKRTMILCVINNRGNHIASPEVINNNRDTIAYLSALIRGGTFDFAGDEGSAGHLRELYKNPLRLAFIDASSPGREMPDRSGGVGAARKMGMDAALRLFDYTIAGRKLLFSLDADTIVADNYLEAVRSFFIHERAAAAVVTYVHQRPATARQRLAISTYEIFLRYYVLGLLYAGSPYSFHTIGSTMICTADAYVAVGGMNRRDAAEDFYFLNKLAKFTRIGRISTTAVYPSARPSCRVPFGTGRHVTRFLEGGGDEFLLYDPRVFLVLKKWLALMKSSLAIDPEEILVLAGKIEPQLLSYLDMNHFPEAWQRIRKNTGKVERLLPHFHFWFDGFKTLKLIHFLTDRSFPKIDMFEAVARLLQMQKSEGSPSSKESHSYPFVY